MNSCSPERLAEIDALLFADDSPYIPHSPTERQRIFLALDCEEAFYGGAAGGGKSDALLMAALQYVDRPGYAALLLRRSYTDLTLPEALMSRAREWLTGKAQWVDKEKTWVFPSKATLTFGYLENENDKYRYQGSAYQYIGFDELTQFTETQYTYLFSRMRKLVKNSSIPLRMRSASNPGGTGAQWVHARFIPEGFTPEMAVEPRAYEKHGEDDEGEPTVRTFVPARLRDNPHLEAESYTRSLRHLDPVTREQLLKGDWSIKERGDILSMWDERSHVISWSEFARVFGVHHIPNTWLLGVYQDWGTTVEHPCVTSWFATAPENAPTVNMVRMAGSVFLYRGLVTHDATVREVALELIRLMAPRGERARTVKWQMSHEAASERIAYNREHDLPFQAWKTGKTRGIAQLRNALELVETLKPHPFKPGVMGHPRIYHVVDDNELAYAKTDAGLVRHRAEAPAYHWATLKSGEPTTSLVPYALFNDAMDTERAAAADYFPDVQPFSERELAEMALPSKIQMENIPKLPPQEQPRAVDAHEFWKQELARKDEPDEDRFYHDNSFTRG